MRTKAQGWRLTVRRAVCWSLIVFAVPNSAHASSEHGPPPEVWLGLAAILLLAKVAAEVAVRLGQPAVLGELCAGILLGNLSLVGWDGFSDLADEPSVRFLSELGVVLLLFEVGLESTVREMRRVAPASGLVAIIGVVVPMLFGFFTSYFLIPDGVLSLHLFVGATLCATSVGITARVLKDLGVMQRPETQIILGAAVIDDVLGLMVLAVVEAIALSGALPDAMGMGRIIGLAFGFLVGALFLGSFLMPSFYRAASKLRAPGVLSSLSIGLCLLLAGLSAWAGLAAIVGAFAAGLVLDEVHVRPFGKKSVHDLSELVAPIVAVMGPIFFVRTGMMVELAGVTGQSLVLAGVLSVVAVLGKLATGLGVRGNASRMAVGVGMVPRGEVGLIFANVGAGVVVAGEPLISTGVYSAIVLMVMVTTIVTPGWLALTFRNTKTAEVKPADNAS